jgi:hypothetical protein
MAPQLLSQEERRVLMHTLMTYKVSIEEDLATAEKFWNDIKKELDDILAMTESYNDHDDKTILLQHFAVADMDKLTDLKLLFEVKKRELDLHIVILEDIRDRKEEDSDDSKNLSAYDSKGLSCDADSEVDDKKALRSYDSVSSSELD